jgi:hypothetical protein
MGTLFEKVFAGAKLDEAARDNHAQTNGDTHQQEAVMKPLSREETRKASQATIAYLLLSLDKPIDSEKVVRLDDLFGLSENAIHNKQYTLNECDEFVGTLPENTDERYKLILARIDSTIDEKTIDRLMGKIRVFYNFREEKPYLWFLLNLVVDDDNMREINKTC